MCVRLVTVRTATEQEPRWELQFAGEMADRRGLCTAVLIALQVGLATGPCHCLANTIAQTLCHEIGGKAIGAIDLRKGAVRLAIVQGAPGIDNDFCPAAAFLDVKYRCIHGFGV